MNYFSQIFTDYMRLSVGTNSECFCEYPELFYCKSYFNDSWYNLLIPKLGRPTQLNFNNMKDFVQREESSGRKLSFYVNSTVLESYSHFLTEAGYNPVGSDVYLLKNLSVVDPVGLETGYTISNHYSLPETIKVLESCFPGWSSEKEYSTLYENYKLTGQEDRYFETFVINFLGKIVGGGSVSIDKNLNLGYLHNAGVSETHRKKGLHTALINERCHYCFEHGVSRVLSIVDEKAGSFVSLQKNGFTIADKFLVYSK